MEITRYFGFSPFISFTAGLFGFFQVISVAFTEGHNLLSNAQLDRPLIGPLYHVCSLATWCVADKALLQVELG